ncbi:MAG: hypothetical protein JNM17_18835 [Archangium sp.]|nr:hypothetical protein [Archangium sp.]
MCCFSGAVKDVSSTRLFARALGGARQLLVYELSLDATQDVAMILPVPVAKALGGDGVGERNGTGEDGVRFVDLSGCPKFFDELDALYPRPQRHSGGFLAPASIPPRQRLPVKQVGSFEASFAPTRADLSRLDERFRLPASVMDELSEHASSGFVVFKLRGFSPAAPPAQRGSGERRIHPMAFDFPQRDAGTLFFPTVHVHDGAVHTHAKFDHLLYAQPLDSWTPHMTWWRAPNATSTLSAAARAFVGVTPIFRTQLSGELPNRDVWLDFATLEGRNKFTPHAHLRVLTAWEMLSAPGRGAATSPNGLDPQVWAELQVTEEQRRRVATNASRALEEKLVSDAQLGVIAYDESLPEVWPDFYGMGGAVAPEVPSGCHVKFSVRGGGVFSVEVRIAFARVPTIETCARVRSLLQEIL